MMGATTAVAKPGIERLVHELKARGQVEDLWGVGWILEYRAPSKLDQVATELRIIGQLRFL